MKLRKGKIQADHSGVSDRLEESLQVAAMIDAQLATVIIAAQKAQEQARKIVQDVTDIQDKIKAKG